MNSIHVRNRRNDMSVTITELEAFLDFVRQEIQAGWNQFSLSFFVRIWEQSQGDGLQPDSLLNLHSDREVAKQPVCLNRARTRARLLCRFRNWNPSEAPWACRSNAICTSGPNPCRSVSEGTITKARHRIDAWLLLEWITRDWLHGNSH